MLVVVKTATIRRRRRGEKRRGKESFRLAKARAWERYLNTSTVGYESRKEGGRERKGWEDPRCAGEARKRRQAIEIL